MSQLETMLWGFLGSVAVELITLVNFYTSRRGRLPGRYRKVGFWITRVVLALVAGAVAVAYDIDQRILAFNIGVATPLIITFMAKGLRSSTPAAGPLAELPDRRASEPSHEKRAEANGTPSGTISTRTPRR